MLHTKENMIKEIVRVSNEQLECQTKLANVMRNILDINTQIISSDSGIESKTKTRDELMKEMKDLEFSLECLKNLRISLKAYANTLDI